MPGGWAEYMNSLIFAPRAVLASILQVKDLAFREDSPCPKHTVSRWRKPEGSPRPSVHPLARPHIYPGSVAGGGCGRMFCKAPTLQLSHLPVCSGPAAFPLIPPSSFPASRWPGPHRPCNLAEWTPGARLPAPSPRSFDKRQGPNGVQGVHMPALGPRSPGRSRIERHVHRAPSVCLADPGT